MGDLTPHEALADKVWLARIMQSIGDNDKAVVLIAHRDAPPDRMLEFITYGVPTPEAIKEVLLMFLSKL